jgi:hypothetical protein
MSARAASPRVLVLAGVAALHALALLLLVTGTRARLVPPGMTDVAPLIVALLEPHERPRTAASGHVPRALSPRIAPTAPLPSEAPPVPPRPDAGTAIDWAAQATASANDQLAADALRTRQASALAPPKSALFAAQAKRHGFQWDYARAHRVEGIPGLATVVHLGDRCAVAFFLIIPFAGGCALEKPQARGDLFDHMHDGEP